MASLEDLPGEIQDTIFENLFSSFSIKLTFRNFHHEDDLKTCLKHMVSSEDNAEPAFHPGNYIINQKLFPRVLRAHVKAFNGCLTLRGTYCDVPFGQRSLHQKQIKEWLLRIYGQAVNRLDLSTIHISCEELASFCQQLPNLEQFNHKDFQRNDDNLVPIHSVVYSWMEEELILLWPGDVLARLKDRELVDIFDKHVFQGKDDLFLAVAGRDDIRRTCRFSIPVIWYHNWADREYNLYEIVR